MVLTISPLFSQNHLMVYFSGDATSINSNEFDNSGMEGKYYNPIANWKLGFEYAVKLSPKIAVFTGLKYKNLGAISPEFVFGTGVDPTTGERITTQIKYNYAFLEIPLGLNYTMHKSGKTSFSVFAGTGFNYFLNHKNVILHSNGEKEKESKKGDEIDAKKWQHSIHFGFSFDHQLSENIGIVVRPNVDFHLSNFYNDSSKQTNFNSFGLALGLRKTIGKGSGK